MRRNRAPRPHCRGLSPAPWGEPGTFFRYNAQPVPARRVHPEAVVPLYAFSLISLLIQVGLIVHVVRTGRSWIWIAAIGFLPGAGSLAYVAVELLPELLGGGAARRAKSGVRRIIDPNRGLRQANTEVEISGNVDARRRLADELMARDQYDRAIEVYGGGLTGIFEHDPALLVGLAKAQFAKRDFAAARTTLQRLADNNPEFKSADSRLLYARTLEAVGALDESEREYAAVAPAFPGAEARLRYGLLLKRRGKTEESRRVLKDLLDSAEIAPGHYRKAQAEWLQLARSALG